MKIIIYTISILILFLLSACSGSETYRGKWKATDVNNLKSEITFQAAHFSIKTSENDISTFNYSQNKISITNGVETYGLQTENGKVLQIIFPIANDETKGAILDAQGYIIYYIGRKEFVKHNDVYGT